MKTKYNYSGCVKIDHKLFTLLILLIMPFVMLVHAQGIAEIKLTAGDSILSLQAENIKTQKRAFFAVSQTVHYKIHSSKHFQKGQITWITDSTISFQNKKMESVTFMHKDLAAFKIPRRGVRNIGGNFLFDLGLLSFLGIGGDGGFIPPGVVLILTLPLLGGGMALKSDKKIYLEKSWTLKTTKAIVPENIITAIMKNGEVITIKVRKITSKNVIGVQSSLDSNGQWVKLVKKIVIKDVVQCSRSIN